MVGRPKKYDEPMKKYTLSVRIDQLAYLKKQENASELIRKLLDKHIETEAGDTQLSDAISIAKWISAREKQLTALTEEPEYKRVRKGCEDVDWLREFRDGMPENESLICLVVYDKDKPLYLRVGARVWSVAESPSFPKLPGWRSEEFEDFLKAQGVNSVKSELNVETAVAVINRMVTALEANKTVKAAYDAKISGYKQEIDNLQRKLHDS